MIAFNIYHLILVIILIGGIIGLVIYLTTRNKKKTRKPGPHPTSGPGPVPGTQGGECKHPTGYETISPNFKPCDEGLYCELNKNGANLCKQISKIQTLTPRSLLPYCKKNHYRSITEFGGSQVGGIRGAVNLVLIGQWDPYVKTYGNISDWNVRKVKDMNNLFMGATTFTGDISCWDVSNVQDMSYMFSNATSFNGDISNWNVGNVQNMSHMFHNATSFNGDISNWDVSNVTDMSYMFNGATAFNQNISIWKPKQKCPNLCKSVFIGSGLDSKNCPLVQAWVNTECNSNSNSGSNCWKNTYKGTCPSKM